MRSDACQVVIFAFSEILDLHCPTYPSFGRPAHIDTKSNIAVLGEFEKLHVWMHNRILRATFFLLLNSWLHQMSVNMKINGFQNFAWCSREDLSPVPWSIPGENEELEVMKVEIWDTLLRLQPVAACTIWNFVIIPT